MRTSRLLVCLICVACLFLLAGCRGKGYEGPPRAEVVGSVSLGGAPLAAGSLTLLPVGHEGAKASVSIEKGAYHIPEAQGPHLGLYKVEVYGFGPGEEASRAPPPGGEEPGLKQILPPKYNTQTTLQIEIVKGKNTHDFLLTP